MKPRRATEQQPIEAPADLRDDIYNLETAARRCRVSEDQVRKWIAHGLRAFPLGDAVEYRPRDYVILEEWLLDFFRGRGIVKGVSADESKGDGRKKKAPKGVTKDYPLGPPPS